ncbi:MAG: M23 family metallopeptidase [Oscillospiraceae bacterium]|jgi:murein DD-endopeptidase MepM/ murein hydrolase activator NlpD|nr:M23 family metallopeptidase [Oscillospiraceae bacterium]
MEDYNRELSFFDSESRFADIRSQRAARQQRKAKKEKTETMPFRMEEIRGKKQGDYEEEAVPPRESYGITKPTAGSYGKVMIAQLLVCGVLLGGVVGAKQLAPQTYSQIRAVYHEAMLTDMTVGEVWQAIKKLTLSLKDEIYVSVPALTPDTRGATADTSEAASETAAEESGHGEEEAVDSAAESPAPTEDGENPNPPSAPITDTAYGAGGKDVAQQYADKSCTQLPLVTTAPVSLPLDSGRISSLFGLRIHPVTGEEGIHTGLDIAAPEGTPIHAAYYGKVAAAAVGKDYGNYIILEHAGGFRTVYAHCSEILVEEGMVIRAGETIALVGSTGQSNGPHLHFETRLGATRADPRSVIPADAYPLAEDVLAALAEKA